MKGRGQVFRHVGGVRPGRSAFDLSYEKLLTCDMGELIPVLCDEAVPGDIWEIGNMAVLRFQPLVAPIMHQVNMYVHYYFVPYRLIWDDWELFITGGPDGTDTTVPPCFDDDIAVTPKNGKGTLWDYFGFPVDVDPDGAYPSDFPRRAYLKIYNDFYRDENFIDELDITDQDNYEVLYRAWEKDYFTSALASQQRGTSPAFPIVGTTSAVWDDALFIDSATGTDLRASNTASTLGIRLEGATPRVNARDTFNENTVDIGSATPLDISDMRLGFQIQRWLERNNRAGARYTEFLKSHFNVSPSDDRLQRPEYIGGSKTPVIVSEVLQTSETDGSPQGNMAGHGIAVSAKYCAKYRVKEFGLIMGIMSVMPKPVYQQGINRQWLRTTRYDYYFPEFANLSEQAIMNVEIFATGVDTDNVDLFGYQGQYDEMRIKHNMVCGDFRDTYDYWHMSRQFAGPAAPVLNQSFVECVPRKDCFAAPSEPGLLVQFGNLIKALRPLPLIANPGYIDH